MNAQKQLAAVCMLLSLSLLATGCRRNASTTVSAPKMQGVFILPVPGVSKFLPIDDGRRAFGWSPNDSSAGAFLVDAQDLSRTIPIGLPASTDLEDAWLAKDRHTVWVTAIVDHQWQLLLIKSDGQIESFNLPRFPEKGQPTIRHQGDYVWVIPDQDAQLPAPSGSYNVYVAKVGGGTVTLDGHAHSFPLLKHTGSQIHLLGDGGSLLLGDDSESSWSVLNADGTVQPLIANPFSGKAIVDEHAIDDTDQAAFVVAPHLTEAEGNQSLFSILFSSLNTFGNRAKRQEHADNTHLLVVDHLGHSMDVPFQSTGPSPLVARTFSDTGHMLWTFIEDDQGKQHLFLTQLVSKETREVALPPKRAFDYSTKDNESAFPVGDSPQIFARDMKSGNFWLLDASNAVTNATEYPLTGGEAKGTSWQVAQTDDFVLVKPEDEAPILSFNDGQGMRSRTILTNMSWSRDSHSPIATARANAWIDGYPQGLVIVGPRVIRRTSFSSDHSSLTTANASGVLAARDSTFDLTMTWPRPPHTQNPLVQAQLILYGDGKEVYRSATYSSSDNEPHWKIALQDNWSKAVKGMKGVDAVVAVKDDFGSAVEIKWTNVHITYETAGLFEQRWFRSILAYVSLILLALSFLKFGKGALTLRRFGPLVTWSGSFLAAISPTLDRHLDTKLLAALLGVTLISVVPISLLSPSLLRTLAVTEPFRWLVPFLVTVPHIRKSLFSLYIEELEHELGLIRQFAGQETYVTIPATVLQEEHGVPSIQVVADPAALIRSHVTCDPPQTRLHILIQAPGGRGKSALLREALRLTLEEFRRNPMSPLPVLCQPGSAGIPSAVTTALGRHVLLKENVELELKAGLYCLFVDGGSELSLAVSSLDEYFKSSASPESPLVLASRPDESVSQAFQRSRTYLVVQPERLTDDNLQTFVDAYRGAGISAGATGLSASSARACQADDGTYLPILVRLATALQNEHIETMAELYRASLKQMLRKGSGEKEEVSEELTVGAAELCVRTYWNNQVRALAYATAPPEDKVVMRQLLQAGVLVSADYSPTALKNEPREVRFFHDSMQSYLTALGLFRQTSRWSDLLRAAGAPGFAVAQSDFAEGAGSELFRMCMEIYRPHEECRLFLRDQLNAWAKEYGDELARNAVVRLVPRMIQDSEHWDEDVMPTSASVLQHATGLGFEADSARRNVAALSILYGRIAPAIWSLAVAKEAEIATQKNIPAS